MEESAWGEKNENRWPVSYFPRVSPGAEVDKASPPMCFGVECGTCVCKCRNRLLVLALGRFGAAGLDLCSECQTGLGQCHGLCQVEPAVVKQAPCQELVRNE
ncbi:acid trehalase-like protein 1 [Platysternon megacephalum]|uniref:Acid trehalase-like protein 1 n=1 Tax=Platysternon megacephalum TaxID=55544 RepID=A0A4D9DPQ8_9SAUR|nr:acid trehalase-like protein 1 [Platysternon megacephalum]